MRETSGKGKRERERRTRKKRARRWPIVLCLKPCYINATNMLHGVESRGMGSGWGETGKKGGIVARKRRPAPRGILRGVTHAPPNLRRGWKDRSRMALV